MKSSHPVLPLYLLLSSLCSLSPFFPLLFHLSHDGGTENFIYKDGSWNLCPVNDDRFLNCTSCFYLIPEWHFFRSTSALHIVLGMVYSLKKYPWAPVVSFSFLLLFLVSKGLAERKLCDGQDRQVPGWDCSCWPGWSRLASAICLASPWLAGHRKEWKPIKKDDLYQKETICKQLPGPGDPEKRSRFERLLCQIPITLLNVNKKEIKPVFCCEANEAFAAFTKFLSLISLFAFSVFFYLVSLLAGALFTNFKQGEEEREEESEKV